MILFVYFILLFLSGTLYFYNKKLLSKILLAVTFFLFVTRLNIGADWINYRKIFNHEVPYHGELFWHIFFINELGPQLGFRAFIIVQSFLYLLPLLYIAKKEENFSLGIFLSMALYSGFIIIGNGALRQSVACSLFFLTYYLYLNRSKYTIHASIPAVLFHFSGFVSLGIPLLNKFENKFEKYLKYSPIFIFVLFFAFRMLNVSFGYGHHFSKGTIFRAIFLLANLLIIYKFVIEKYKRIAILVSINIIALALVSYIFNYTTLVDRMFLYLVFPISFHATQLLLEKKKKSYFYMFSVFQLIFLIVWYKFSNISDFFHYKNLFFSSLNF